MKKPALSLCMIVKDEEERLPRCLASVKEWVDEVVVVDTGSADRTVEIALRHGARVFHHPWEGDFSKHQNQSVDHATGEWLLQMDGDEALQEGSGPRIREAIRDQEADAFYVTILSLFNQGASSSWESKIRLFRNRPSIRYENIVHKQLRGYRCAKAIGATILHYGYDLSFDEQIKKFERTSSLLRRQVAEDPENYWHRHNLAVCLASNACYREAVEMGLSALSLAGTQGLDGPNVLWTSYIVSASYLKLGDLNSAEEIALGAVGRFKDHLDCHFVLVLLYHQRKQWERLELHGREYLRIHHLMKNAPERFAGHIINMAGEAWRVRVALGDSSLRQGCPDKARALFEASMQDTFLSSECFKMIGDCYKNHSLWQEAVCHYRQASERKTGDLSSLLGLALCQERLGHEMEALRSYEQALKTDPTCLESLVNVGDIYYRREDWERASDYYERALDLDPRLVPTALKLANLSSRKGDLELCLKCCENILGVLRIAPKKVLDSLQDLADLFLAIGYEMDRAGREDLFKEAMEVAVRLHPELITGLRPMEGGVPATQGR